MIKDEHIYIAGPLCFYKDGNSLWNAFRKEAEFYGFDVTLPNDNKLVEEGETVTKEEMSKRIFGNCSSSMAKSNGIIVNLETYRGSEPDGGSIYELGMAYALGGKCYGFTRDKRKVGVKYQAAKYNKDAKGALDIDGNNLGHPELPFSVCIVGSTKIVEGSFSDCLKVYMTDIEEESKQKAMRGFKVIEEESEEVYQKGEKPVVYLSDGHRDDLYASAKYDEKKKILEKYGFEVITPIDKAPGVEVMETDDIYERVYNIFDHYQQHVRDCDIILADLNDFRGGYEPNSDVAFECGMAYELDKKMYGYMNNIGRMIDRIPCLEDGDAFRDFNGMSVENFNAPLNLMFGASMKLLDGNFEEVVKKMKEDLEKE